MAMESTMEISFMVSLVLWRLVDVGCVSIVDGREFGWYDMARMLVFTIGLRFEVYQLT